MSFYTSIAIRHEQLKENGRLSSQARKICKEEFEVSAQTVSDALLFLQFPRQKNKTAYELYEQQHFSTSTLILIFKAAKRLKQETTNGVIEHLLGCYPLKGTATLDKTTTARRRGGGFPVSQTDVENWMKEAIPPIR